MTSPVNIGILGAEGRMGQALITAIAANAGANLCAALTLPTSPNLGKDVGGAVLTSDVRAALQDCDVIIDFSQPQAAIDTALMMYNTPCKTLVSGTTGYTPTEEKALIASADNITLVKSGNFSIGIRVLEALAEKAAAILGEGWDISVLDIHHRHKVDAPSGTALMLGAAAKAGQTKAGAPEAVEYAAQRFGGVIGDHHVSLATEQETITLSHRANDRALFAQGALKAALWAVDQDKGLYDMKDVLGL